MINLNALLIANILYTQRCMTCLDEYGYLIEKDMPCLSELEIDGHSILYYPESCEELDYYIGE